MLPTPPLSKIQESDSTEVIPENLLEIVRLCEFIDDFKQEKRGGISAGRV